MLARNYVSCSSSEMKDTTAISLDIYWDNWLELTGGVGEYRGIRELTFWVLSLECQINLNYDWWIVLNNAFIVVEIKTLLLLAILFLSTFPSIVVFSRELDLCIMGPKYDNLSLIIHALTEACALIYSIVHSFFGLSMVFFKSLFQD